MPSGALAGGVMPGQVVAMLQSRLSGLNRQLRSLADHRRQLVEQIRHSSGADRAGLESRLTQLDGRIGQLEGEIDLTGEQLANATAANVGTTSPPRDFGPRQMFAERNIVPIVVPFTLFVLCPIAVSISRLIWKRGSRITSPALPSDSAQRLERIEQGMDAIAIEVERVSEGQRFVTRLLSERGPEALASGRGAAEPVRVPLRDGERAR